MDRATDQLIENSFERRIREVDRISQELKSAQMYSGASGQLSYRIASEDNWDISESLSSGSLTLITFDVTVTPDGTQDYPEVLLYVDVRANGTSESNKLVPLNGNYGGVLFNGGIGWASGSDVMRAGSIIKDLEFIETPGPRIWTLNFFYKGNVTYYLKAKAMSSCGGSISVVRSL